MTAEIESRIDSNFPSAFSIDIGIIKPTNQDLSSQQYIKECIIECNDCFSLGSYSLDTDLYCEMIRSRWNL